MISDEAVDKNVSRPFTWYLLFSTCSLLVYTVYFMNLCVLCHANHVIVYILWDTIGLYQKRPCYGQLWTLHIYCLGLHYRVHRFLAIFFIGRTTLVRSYQGFHDHVIFLFRDPWNWICEIVFWKIPSIQIRQYDLYHIISVWDRNDSMGVILEIY